MKLTKATLKKIIREEIGRVLNEGYGSLSPEEISSLGVPSNPNNPKSSPKLSAEIASAWLDDALSNYVVGYTSGDGGLYGIDTSVYDAGSSKSAIDPKLASQYQAALEEGHIGRGERGQRRFLDRLVDKHWEKLLQTNIAKLGKSQPVTGWELTFGDLLDVLAFHGGDAEDYKDSLRHRLDQKLNKPPAKLGGARRKSQDLRSDRWRELGKHRANYYRQGE